MSGRNGRVLSKTSTRSSHHSFPKTPKPVDLDEYLDDSISDSYNSSSDDADEEGVNNDTETGADVDFSTPCEDKILIQLHAPVPSSSSSPLHSPLTSKTKTKTTSTTKTKKSKMVRPQSCKSQYNMNNNIPSSMSSGGAGLAQLCGGAPSGFQLTLKGSTILSRRRMASVAASASGSGAVVVGATGGSSAGESGTAGGVGVVQHALAS
ncbi:unnamed protein product [Ambrosiozyma monospora]|uniref:Unnamed protein product n=1 Tax=Ambrosiozyma monospora TaxID=43982 RepID=A0A9W6SZM8_AMBMO|nr:unnamed protein product [Ambrosiozyma monospora]